MSTRIVELPSILAAATGGKSTYHISGSTLKELWENLLVEEPRLKTHLFDETQELREHVLCFLNGTNTRWLPKDSPVAEGDVVLFMQAVTGG